MNGLMDTASKRGFEINVRGHFYQEKNSYQRMVQILNEKGSTLTNKNMIGRTT